MAPRPAAAVSAGRLLEMHILRPHARPAKSAFYQALQESQVHANVWVPPPHITRTT